MILGLGVDLVEVRRIESAVNRYGERFVDRIFTADEVARCRAQRHPGQAFAVRFAAKEAFAKAIGTGVARGLKWLDIEVRRIESGQPALVLAGAAQREAHRLGVSRIHLSLSHEKGMAVAMVVLES